MENTYIEIKIKTGLENLDRVENLFYRLGRFEISVEDPRYLFEENYLNLDIYFEEHEVFPNGKDICTVKCYLSREENIIEFLKILRSTLEFENINCELETNEIFEEDWANNWKKYYHTFKINDMIIVKPEWEDYEVSEGEILINIDPGMAFGTGTHETTKLCMLMINKYMKKGSFAYDVGTGSGILAILMSKLGASKVVAVDLDKVSVSSAKHNVSLNNISNIDVLEGNLLDKATCKGDIIVSNIIAEVIFELIPDVLKIINDDGIFIASGIIESKVNLIKNRIEDCDLKIVDDIRENGWVAFAIKNI